MTGGTDETRSRPTALVAIATARGLGHVAGRRARPDRAVTDRAPLIHDAEGATDRAGAPTGTSSRRAMTWDPAPQPKIGNTLRAYGQRVREPLHHNHLEELEPRAKTPEEHQTAVVPLNEVSWASSAGRRRNMQAIRSRDTQPELAVRRRLHSDGLRYRVAAAPLPGLRRKADIVFTRSRIAVFVDGCFWHGCPEHGKRDFQHNVEYWPQKIATNKERDEDTNERLQAAGWTVLRFWEHEDPAAVAEAIKLAVRKTGS